MVFFFFKQKTAYEIMPSLVGSEMCIRDRVEIGGIQRGSAGSVWAAVEDRDLVEGVPRLHDVEDLFLTLRRRLEHLHPACLDEVDRPAGLPLQDHHLPAVVAALPHQWADALQFRVGDCLL